MSSGHLGQSRGQYKGKFYIMDEVSTANVPPTKAPVTRMRFQIVPFSYRFHFAYSNVCVFIIVFIVSA